MGSPQVRPDIIRFGIFEADLQAGELRRNGAKVRVQDLPFRALTLFLSRPGEVISRDDMRQALWPPDVFVDFEQGISSAVMRLREALHDSADNPIFIQTIERRGYRWIAPVLPAAPPRLEVVSTQLDEPAAPLPASPTPETSAPLPFERPAAAPVRRWDRLAYALPVLALLLVVWISRPGFRDVKAGVRPISSIAILPFDNLSAPAYDDAFSDGLTDEVAASISHLQGVQVTGRRSAYMFKGKHADLRDIGSKLKVEAVVEGSVQRTGDRTRVTVELNRTQDGFTIWSQTFDGTAADWFQIESEIANSIALKLAHRVASAPAASGQYDAEAHSLYLEARYLWSQRNFAAELKSVDLLQQAIARDPDYALAWAGLADSLISIGDVEEVKPSDYLPRARDAALKALQLDPSLAEAHAALGMIACHYDYDWPTAEREYKKAFELNPSYASAHQYYSLGLMAHGRFPEAETQLAIARRLDPLALIVEVDTALLRKYQRDYDGIISVSKGILDRDPNYHLAYSMLTTGYYLEHRWDEWRAADDKVPQGDFFRDLVDGRRKDALRDFHKTLEKERIGQARPSLVVGMANRLHDRALTLDLMEEAYEQHDYWQLFVNVDPEYDWLHSEPRYQSLIKKLGVE
jgi:TolB-like protein/DNA-binding winged helix-turn-helix (wHTH) protein